MIRTWPRSSPIDYYASAHSATCTLQHALCNTHSPTHSPTHTLQHTLCNTHSATHTLQHTLCNTHSATHTLQHTLTSHTNMNYPLLCFCCKTHSLVTGWRRLIGSPKLQIIFHERATKYRSLLRKMTYKDKGSYESSPPCTRRRPINYSVSADVVNAAAAACCCCLLLLSTPATVTIPCVRLHSACPCSRWGFTRYCWGA